MPVSELDGTYSKVPCMLPNTYTPAGDQEKREYIQYNIRLLSG